MISAMCCLYRVSGDKVYLDAAIKAQKFIEKNLCEKDTLYVSFREGKRSGNSAMAYNLVQLFYLTGKDRYSEIAEKQLKFLADEAGDYPSGHAMFLIALLDYDNVPDKVTVVVKEKSELENLECRVPLDAVICVLEKPTKDYPLLNDKTTFYVCKGHVCLPPVNEL